ncbi:MAG: hypothetical protein ABSG61_14180 [Gemmatimonadales bacterium]
MALPPRNHRISLAEAAAHTKRHRDAKVSDVKAGAFHKDQVLDLLSQTGCVGLRIYYGRDPAGAPNLVLTGIDSADNDLTAGVILEISFPCPPFCGGGNSLNT